MRIHSFWLGLSICFFFACSSKHNDPIEGQAIPLIPVQRFDTAFFAMDTNQISRGIASLYERYPQFSADYFSKILQVDPVRDSQKIKRYFKIYLPIYKNALKVNAPKSINVELNKAFARFHFYFPKYKMPPELIYYMSPLLTSFNVLSDHYIGVGLQISTFDHYIPQEIPFHCIQNVLDDYLFNKRSEPELVYQMIEAGKRQYMLQTISLHTPDTLLWNYSSLQLKAVQEQESAIWQYLVEQKMLLSKERIDALNTLGDAEQNSLLGAPLPGNIGKYIGYKMVSAYMKKQRKSTYDDLEKLAETPASVIYAEAGYQP
jgi:hypothetical protein